MGHFGRTPIRWAWYARRVPRPARSTTSARARCYLERGRHGQRTRSTIWSSGTPLLIPMIVLATMAAIIASQALISGAFSLTQPGGAARLHAARHGRPHVAQGRGPDLHPRGQLAADGRVRRARARRSSRARALAAAYGIAVTGTMAITSFLYFLVCRRNWGYSWPRALALFIPFVAIDLVVLLGEHREDRRRRLVPARGRRRRVRRDDDVVARPPRAVASTMETGTMPDELFLADIGRDPAAARAGHRGVHGVGHRRHAERAAPPRQAQQGAAQAGRAAVDRHRRTCRSRSATSALDGARARRTASTA